MEIDSGYYKRIVYKKNAFEDLKTYLKLNYSNKNIYIVSSKSVPSNEVAKMLNAVLCGSEKVCHFVARNGFDIRELDKLKGNLSGGDCDLIISFGGGRCCDVVKFFAKQYSLPYIICPSTASSIAYFDTYCINPYNANESFVADPPKKIFIQESLIRNSNCSLNINGLAFLHSLRAVFIEGVIDDKENERYIFVGMEKLFNKLEAEQSSILICNEDSNLILMDLLIDFGFFIDMLGKDYYLFKSFAIYESMRNMSIHSCCGQEILLHSRMILVLVKNFLELGSVKMIEVPNFQEVSNIIENNNISHQKLKKFAYFSNFMQKPYIKKNILCNREGVYKLVCSQILKINNFCKNVKCVYRRGIEIEEDCANLMQAVKVAPYLCCENNLINLIAGSGILNCL